MSQEEIKAKFRRFNEEIYNKGNMDAWDELFVPEYVEHTFPFGDVGPLNVVKQRLAGLKSGVSNYHAMIDELIVEGETVVMRFHSEGIHTGELFSVPSTGRKIVVNGCCVYRMKNGKVVEAFIYNDWLGLLQQLGVIPKLGQAEECPESVDRSAHQLLFSMPCSSYLSSN